MKRIQLLFRALAVLCLVVMMLGLVPVPVAARSSGEIQAEINAKKDQLNALEAEIKNSKTSRQALQAALGEYETQYNELLVLIDEKETSIALRENEVDFKTTQIGLTIESINTNRELFASRMRAIYDMNSTNVLLGTLLQVDSYSDFVLASDVMKRISQNDMQLLESFSQDLENYETQRAGLEEAIAQLDGELKALDEDREWCAQKMEEMQGQIQGLNADIAEGMEQSEKTEEEMQALQSELARLASQQYGKGSQTGDGSVRYDGPLAWPVAGGQVSSWFGDPRSNTGYHYGIDISAPQDTPVLAAAPGVVITAGWHYSYGNWIVIDHGQGLQTWYAHCNYLGVGVGAQVDTGTPIAGVGNTGDSQGNHLHFEVHDGGARQNPAAPQYLNIS